MKGLWWKLLGRNKRTITLDLSRPGGRATLLRLAATADVIIENFRPGTLEKWDLGWAELSAANPRLVLARVTAFGQFGPYAHRPGFGTLAEAMSGFAAITGEPDSPPTLPPFGLADSIAGLATAYAVMARSTPATPRTAARWSTWRSSSRSSPCSAHSRSASTSWATSSPAPATAPRTTRPATPTARRTAPGRRRPPPSRSPSG